MERTYFQIQMGIAAIVEICISMRDLVQDRSRLEMKQLSTQRVRLHQQATIAYR